MSSYFNTTKPASDDDTLFTVDTQLTVAKGPRSTSTPTASAISTVLTIPFDLSPVRQLAFASNGECGNKK